MNGVPVTPKRSIENSPGHQVVPLAIGDWPSGLYYARLRAADGRVGFAPFVVGRAGSGKHRVAVVLPTLTWQAYNLRDEDGDERGDSWYADWKHKTIRLGRPYLSRGVPYNFRRYDYSVPELAGLDRARGGRARAVRPRGRRRLEHARERVRPGRLPRPPRVRDDARATSSGYRDRGGNLLFLREQLLLAGGRARQHDPEDGALA